MFRVNIVTFFFQLFPGDRYFVKNELFSCCCFFFLEGGGVFFLLYLLIIVYLSDKQVSSISIFNPESVQDIILYPLSWTYL